MALTCLRVNVANEVLNPQLVGWGHEATRTFQIANPSQFVLAHYLILDEPWSCLERRAEWIEVDLQSQ